MPRGEKLKLQNFPTPGNNGKFENNDDDNIQGDDDDDDNDDQNDNLFSSSGFAPPPPWSRPLTPRYQSCFLTWYQDRWWYHLNYHGRVGWSLVMPWLSWLFSHYMLTKATHHSPFMTWHSPCDCLPTTETHFLSPRICFRNNLLPKFKSSITNTEKIFVAHHCHTGKDLIESQHSPSFFKKRSLKTSGTCKTCASFCFSQEQNFHSLIVNFSIPVDNHW